MIRDLGLGDVVPGFASHGFTSAKPKQKNHVCDMCNIAMIFDTIHMVCPTCGLVDTAVIHNKITNDSPPPIHYKHRLEYSDPKYNGILNSVYNRLLGRRDKSGLYIAESILKSAAMEYTRIHQEIRETNNGPNDKRRYNNLINAILEQELSKINNMAKTSRFICDFMNIHKSRLSKSSKELMTFSSKGMYKYVKVQSNVESLVYQILQWCKLDMKLHDVIVAVVRTTNIVKMMIESRTCEDKTRCVGATWMIMNQIGVRLPHHYFKGDLISVSKSTYMRFVKFLHINRKVINPVIYKHQIRPIPRSFASPSKNRNNNRLNPLPLSYKGKLIWEGNYE